MTQTLVHIEVAQCAGIAWFTVAFKCARMIDADAVTANGRRRLAFVDVNLAIRSIPSARALAVVFGGATIVTRRSILTRSQRAAAAATADVIRTNAFTILACHRLLAIGRTARFESFASFAIESGWTNAYRTVWAARSVIKTRAIIQRHSDCIATLRSACVGHTALAANALRVQRTFARTSRRILA